MPWIIVEQTRDISTDAERAKDAERGFIARTKDATVDNCDVRIRLYDDDDVLYYRGFIARETLDSDKAFGPLNWARANAGCTRMDYYAHGTGWHQL